MRKSVGSVGRGQLGKRVLSGAMAAVLAVGMMPALAFAGEGEAPEPAMSLTAGMQAQDVAEGSAASVTHDGVEEGYASIAAAIAATQEGDTVKLLQDVSSEQSGVCFYARFERAQHNCNKSCYDEARNCAQRIQRYDPYHPRYVGYKRIGTRDYFCCIQQQF